MQTTHIYQKKSQHLNTFHGVSDKMGFKHFCIYRDFGCDVTRTRRSAIEKHHESCPLATKFKKYIDLARENKFLKDEVSRMSKIRGRPRISLESVDLRDFQKAFIASDDLRNSWRKLTANCQANGVGALLRIFLATSPRFWKILNKEQIEVKGWLAGIRTFGEIELHPIEAVANEIFMFLSYIVEDNVEDPKKYQLDRFYDGVTGHTRYVFLNALRAEVNRRRQAGPVTFNSVRVHI